MSDNIEDYIVRLVDSYGMTIGTGFFVCKNKFIITCKHVIKKLSGEVFYYKTNSDILYNMRLCSNFMLAYDIAILSTDIVPSSAKSVQLCDDSQIGDECKTLGYPFLDGTSICAFPKIVHGFQRNNIDFFQLSDANDITNGFSGAPLIKAEKYCIGIISSIPMTGNSRMTNTAVAISVKGIGKLILDWAKENKISIDICHFAPVIKKSEEHYFNMDDLDFILLDKLDHLRETRKNGYPQEVVKRVDSINKWLDSLIGKNSSKKGLVTHLNEFKLKYLMEKSKSYMDFILPSKVPFYMNRIVKEQKELAMEFSGKGLFYLPRISAESAFYVSKNYYEASKISKELLNEIDNIESEWHIEVLRSAAINAGYVGSILEINEILNMITYFVDLDDDEKANDIIFLYEGIARSLALKADKRAYDYLRKARELLENSGNRGYSLRNVQLLRTEMQIAKQFADKVSFQDAYSKGKKIADSMKYNRYSEEFSNIYKESV